MDFGGLSVRSPWNDGWRRIPSRVQFAYAISATSRGSTQIAPRRVDAGVDLKGGAPRRSASSSAAQVLARVRVESGPHAARINQGTVLVVPDQQGPDAARRLGVLGESADDEFLARAAFRLEPVVAAARPVGRIAALGNDPFQRQGARLLEHVLAPAFDMLGEGKARRRLLACGQQRLEPRLARLKRLVRAGRCRRDAAGRMRGTGDPGRFHRSAPAAALRNC